MKFYKMIPGVCVSSGIAMAATITPPRDHNPTEPSDAAIAYVEAKLVGVQTTALCPEGVTCFANGTVAKLSFEVPCAGGLVEPIEYHVVTNEKFESKVYVRATGILTKKSIVSFCSPGFSRSVDITLINTYVSPENFVDIGAQ